MEKIDNVLSEALKNTSIGTKIKKAQIFLNYEELVGKQIAKISVPTRVKARTLFIGVQSPSWSNQLYFFKRELLGKINSVFDKPLIDDIKFHIYIFDETPEFKEKPYKNDIKIEIPEKKLKMVYNISSKIEDENLRQKFAKLMVKDIKYKIKKGGKNLCSST